MGIRHRPQSPDGFLPRERQGVVPESRGKRIRPRGPSRRGNRRGPAPGPQARGRASACRARRASGRAARGLSPPAGRRTVDRGNRRGDRRQPRDREEPPALCCGEAACEPGEGIMIERRDEELSRIYRDADGPRPPQRVDDNILAASQRVAGPRPAGAWFARRWGTPVALAATVLVTFTLALMVFERESGLDTMAPKAPRADRPAKVAPPEPKRAQPSPAGPPRAYSPEKSSSVDLPRAAPAPAAPSPPAAPRSNRVEQRTVETALSSERRATGQAARVPAVPRGIEILRKNEEVKPSPDAQRAFEAQQQVPPMQAPPAAAPAAEASGIREPGQTPQRAGAVTGIASRVAVSEAKERTPEKWLEDIRKLRTEGKATEVERELAEFKKRYPDYILPEDLR